MNESYIFEIENVLNIKLHDWQIGYIFRNEPIPHYIYERRHNGKTTTRLIHIVLFNEGPININRPIEYTDRLMDCKYTNNFFKYELLKMHSQLKSAGLPVSEINFKWR